MTVFLIETITAVFVLDDNLVDAIYGSAKTLVTVDPNLKVSKGPAWYKVFTSVSMLVALVFAAAFTAGLVDRVTGRRLTGLVGRRAVPRRDHVVVVGSGQVGLRLCMLLRACQIPVVAIERDEEAETVGLAREMELAGGGGAGGGSLADAAPVAAPRPGGGRSHLGRPGQHLNGHDRPRDPRGRAPCAAGGDGAWPTRPGRCSHSG